MVRIANHKWIALLAFICFVAAISSSGDVIAAPGGVQVSDQNDCTVGPTNDNFLEPSQTAYVWLIFKSSTSVRGYTYQIVGTNNPYNSGILKIRFQACKKGFVDDFWASFTTPAILGTYQLTVFDSTGTKVSSDNFTVE